MNKSYMKTSLWIVFLVLFFNGYSFRQENNNINKNTKNQLKQSAMNELRFLALGDSYTIGEAVSENERWPVQLANALSRSGLNMAEPEIIARTGWTTSELAAAIQENQPSGTYHLVSLLIGVNNQYRALDTSDYRIELRELIQKAIDLAGGKPRHVIVVSIPDYGPTPFGQNREPEKISEEIDAFNAIKFDEAKKAKILFIDITPISRKAESNPELLAEDGLHPSALMYNEWVKLIFPHAHQILIKQISK